MDRTRLTGRLRAYAPHILVAGGFVKAIGVAALAPLVGAPMWLALTAAALWVAGPAVVVIFFMKASASPPWLRPPRSHLRKDQASRSLQQLRGSDSDVARPGSAG